MNYGDILHAYCFPQGTPMVKITPTVTMTQSPSDTFDLPTITIIHDSLHDVIDTVVIEDNNP